MLQALRSGIVCAPRSGNAPVHLFDQRYQSQPRLSSLRLTSRLPQHSLDTTFGVSPFKAGLCINASAAASNSKSGAPSNPPSQPVSKESKTMLDLRISLILQHTTFCPKPAMCWHISSVLVCRQQCSLCSQFIRQNWHRSVHLVAAQPCDICIGSQATLASIT